MVIRRQARIMAGHSDREFSTHHLNCHVQSNVFKTMILVCAFYAVAQLPEKFFVLHMALNINLNFLNNAYYVT